VSMCRVGAVVFEPVEVFVPFAADLATIWLVFLHAHSIWIRRVGQGIDDGICAVLVEMQGLVLVAVEFVVFEAVLVFVRLLAANNWTLVGLVLATLHDVEMAGRVVDAHFVAAAAILVHEHRSADGRRVRREKYLVGGHGLQALHALHDGRLDGWRGRDVGFLIVSEQIVQGGQQHAAAAVVLAEVGLEVGQVGRRVDGAHGLVVRWVGARACCS
jgi:hypothetical protein